MTKTPQPVSREAQGEVLLELRLRVHRLYRLVGVIALLATVGALAGTVAVVSVTRAQRHANEQFCALRIHQRVDLERQWNGTVAYLRSPAGQEPTALNAYIRRFSVPQLRSRMKHEIVPSVCAGD